MKVQKILGSTNCVAFDVGKLRLDRVRIPEATLVDDRRCGCAKAMGAMFWHEAPFFHPRYFMTTSTRPRWVGVWSITPAGMG